MNYSKTIKTLVVFLMSLSLTIALVSCKKNQKGENEVRFASVSWTGVTAHTDMAVTILNSLGYDASNTMLSLPIVFQAVDSYDADVFLGVWLPSMKTMVNEYYKKGNIEELIVNTRNAKYTLAVPSYAAEGGLKHFKDIARFGDKLDYKIYGIEEGNDGNEIILNMIKNNMFGLGDFELVASSEAGMLGEVQSAIQEKRWIVFLGWSPHYMNEIIDMTYLNGSTGETFGENDGTATVSTIINKKLKEEDPNIIKFLENYTLPVSMTNEIMDMLNKDSKLKPIDAGIKWMKKNPEAYKKWLDGVTTVDGKPALPVFEKYLESL
jgi:glycine betaine/proline transport system substrate-binding protein